MMNTLIINTSSNKVVIVGLRMGDREDSITETVGRDKAQAVLPIMDSLLTKHGLTTHDLSAIEVHTGPGSFTGLRVGITIANTLAYTLKLPINGNSPGVDVEPIYDELG